MNDKKDEKIEIITGLLIASNVLYALVTEKKITVDTYNPLNKSIHNAIDYIQKENKDDE